LKHAIASFSLQRFRRITEYLIDSSGENEMRNGESGFLHSDTMATSLVPSAVDLGNSVAGPVACICGTSDANSANEKSRSQRLKKTVALYATMVFVSTWAIFFLEHASIVGALRTALVAAVGKTFAATWVTSFFE